MVRLGGRSFYNILLVEERIENFIQRRKRNEIYKNNFDGNFSIMEVEIE